MQGACLQMRIGVGGDLKVCISHPKLDCFHADTLCHKEAGAGVAQIMEAYSPEAVLFKEFWEVRCHVVGSEDVSLWIDTHKIFPLPVVLPAECLFILFVLFPVTKQLFSDKGHKRNRSATIVRLQLV